MGKSRGDSFQKPPNDIQVNYTSNINNCVMALWRMQVTFA